ncbi:hypothetical protein FF011L_16510 [Roseimaritima multifibrata]|uniref:Uncharacterized protein n=1 Tax=Roseimaritima multifibrata TaxID=1930274 RepID=A0A517MDN7_9BACT|nr:hypothetical protein FF011L_16510 [Roseimaritima multifibrata]
MATRKHGYKKIWQPPHPFIGIVQGGAWDWTVKKKAVLVSTVKIWIGSCYELSYWLVTKSPKAKERNSDGIIHKFSRSVQLISL